MTLNARASNAIHTWYYSVHCDDGVRSRFFHPENGCPLLLDYISWFLRHAGTQEAWPSLGYGLLFFILLSDNVSNMWRSDLNRISSTSNTAVILLGPFSTVLPLWGQNTWNLSPAWVSALSSTKRAKSLFYLLPNFDTSFKTRLITSWILTLQNAADDILWYSKRGSKPVNNCTCCMYQVPGTLCTDILSQAVQRLPEFCKHWMTFHSLCGCVGTPWVHGGRHGHQGTYSRYFSFVGKLVDHVVGHGQGCCGASHSAVT